MDPLSEIIILGCAHHKEVGCCQCFDCVNSFVAPMVAQYCSVNYDEGCWDWRLKKQHEYQVHPDDYEAFKSIIAMMAPSKFREQWALKVCEFYDLGFSSSDEDDDDLNEA